MTSYSVDINTSDHQENELEEKKQELEERITELKYENNTLKEY